MLRTLLCAAIAGTFLHSGGAMAADVDYPTKPITMYIGYKAGGGTDTVGRVFAQFLARELGQQVNVVNQSGAGGGVAAMKVSRAKPDGYTLLFNPSSAVTAGPHITKNITVRIKDFEYAGTLAAFQGAIVSPKDAPYSNYKEFVAFAKKQGNVDYATISPFARMAMQVIAEKEGFQVNYVPAKGSADTMSMLMGKQIEVAYSGGVHARYPDEIKTVIPISRKRQPGSPDLPTLMENGVDISVDSQMLISAPKGTPDSIMNKLEKAVKAASEDESVKDIAQKMLYPIDFNGRADTLEEMKRQWQGYGQMVEVTGFKSK